MRYFQLTVLLLVLLPGPFSIASAQQAQTTPQVQTTPDEEQQNPPNTAGTDGTQLVTVDPDALPINIDRIQRRLSRPPAIRPETSRQVFRVEVFGRSPTIDEILGPNWRRGPVPSGTMSHQEFLNMVTPKDVQGFAAFDNRQAMMVAATSFALQWALRQAVQKLDDARSERQREAAQREVEAALAALRRARRDAGLPDY
jgi:hypothetical protein